MALNVNLTGFLGSGYWSSWGLRTGFHTTFLKELKNLQIPGLTHNSISRVAFWTTLMASSYSPLRAAQLKLQQPRRHKRRSQFARWRTSWRRRNRMKRMAANIVKVRGRWVWPKVHILEGILEGIFRKFNSALEATSGPETLSSSKRPGSSTEAGGASFLSVRSDLRVHSHHHCRYNQHNPSYWNYTLTS